jgi:glycosyltransferase involved in cell wall biosynthesis
MVTVVYCTREINPAHKEHLIKSSGLQKNIEIIEIINQGESLTTAYNRGLKQAKNNIVVFCHDDLTIETNRWGEKLLKQFTKHPEFGILGVAGTKYMPSSGQWWERKKKMYGRVSHTHEGKTWLSSYSSDMGQDIEETVIVDGVFFAVDKSKLKAEFNEQVEGFHFYDINFCFDNYLAGTKIGVTTLIRVNHKSIGMTNAAWESARLAFAEKFKERLPVEIKKIFRKGEKQRVLIGCLSLIGNSPEETYIMNLIRQLIKENCDVSIASNIDKKIGNILKQMGVKMYTLKEPPSFKLGDGKWSLKSATGLIPSQESTLYKVNDISFDTLYISQKPVADHLLRLYPDTDTICVIHSNEKALDEPVVAPQIIKYIAMNELVKDVLIEGYGIDSNLVEEYTLPVEISEKKVADIDTYIFVHDQSIIKRFEESEKFAQLSNYKYVFLGDKDTSELSELTNVIYANKLPSNLEAYPKFTAFSGWYALWKNKLLTKGNDVLLLEYDVHLTNDFEKHISNSFGKKPGMVGFVPFQMTNTHFVNNPDWVGVVNEVIKKKYNMDAVGKAKDFINMAVKNGQDPMWLSTNNILFNYETFIKYMEWFEPLIDGVKNDINCGHGQERCLTFFAMLTNTKFDFIRNVLRHEQLDSHKTQGHSVDFEAAIERLA